MADETTVRLFEKLDEVKQDTAEIKERMAYLEAAHEFRKEYDIQTSSRIKVVEERVDVLEKDKAAVLGVKWLIPILATFGLSLINFLMELKSR